MKEIVARIILFLTFIVLVCPTISAAQDATDLEPLTPDPVFADSIPEPEYFRATVTETSDQESSKYGTLQKYQLVKARIDSGSSKNDIVDIDHGLMFELTDAQRVSVGEQVVLTKNYKIDGSVFGQLLTSTG